MKTYVFIVSVFIILLLSSCGEKSNSDESGLLDNQQNIGQGEVISNVRYDTEQLKEWFPNFDEIISAEWEMYPEGDNNYPIIPLRGAFSARGYFTLDEEKADEYMQVYQWDEVTPDVEMKYVSSDKLNNGTWLFSWQFDHDFLPITFAGYLWFDGETVLFNVWK